MKKKIQILALLSMASLTACQDQLDITNPNEPTPESAKTEQGIIALAQGGVYINGLQTAKGGGIVFLGFVIGNHERMGDTFASPFGIGPMFTPLRITLDNGSTLEAVYPGGNKKYLRDLNVPSQQLNPFLSEWSFMYGMNGAMNLVLAGIGDINMPNGKKVAIIAWARFWKGFAYSRLGSMYCAGIINENYNETNSKYVSRQELLAEAERNFGLAEGFLKSITPEELPDYTKVIDELIPGDCKKGKGFPVSVSEWLKNINTLRARNILVNTPASEMTTTQWDQVLALTSGGVMKNDLTFTLRTDELGNLMATNGYASAQAIGPASNGGGVNKVSERLIQDFKAGDKRLANNFNQIPPWTGPNDRGTNFNTRYVLVNKGKNMPGVVVMCNRDVGADEIYIAGCYEENVLMLAEANIYKGNIDVGLAYIDELRNYQGAGLAPVAGTGLTPDQAREELRRERRVGLAFRGFAFYDARRWGVLKNARTGCTVIDFNGVVSTNATIDYSYLEYWDVPIAESFYNPPSADSAPIVSPD